MPCSSHYQLSDFRSQIGRCNNRESFKNQQNLQRAMFEAKKLISHSPLAGTLRHSSPSPIILPETTGQSIEELLHDIKEETRGFSTPTPEPARRNLFGGTQGENWLISFLSVMCLMVKKNINIIFSMVFDVLSSN